MYAQRENGLNIFHGTDAAAQLDGQSALSGPPDNFAVFPFAVPRAVQVHHMEMTGAGGVKRLRDGYRIAGDLMHSGEIAFFQPDHLSVFQVNGGKDQHDGPSSSQKAFKICRPIGPLFSGWN